VIAAETRAGELANELGDELGVAWSELAIGMRAMQCNSLAIAISSLRRAEQLFLTGSLSHARETTFARIAILTVCGNYCVDLGYARRNVARVEEEAMSRGDVFGATWAQLTRCFIALSADDPKTARASVTGARNVWPRAVDSMFAAMCLLYELSVDQYEDPAGSLAQVTRVEPEFRQLFTSLVPFPRALFCRIAAISTMSAWVDGQVGRDFATKRIGELVEELAATPSRPAGHLVLQSFQRALAGDKAGQITVLEAAAADWTQSRQRAHALTALFRVAQLRGDTERARTIEDELRAQSIGAPDRFAVLMVGPAPR
jgi:hypothetical protein